MIQPVLRNDEITPGTFLLRVERRHPFMPGQTVKIGLGDGLPPRIYSICSGPQDRELGVLYNIKADGALTPRLAQLKPGDPIDLSAPGGTFIGTADPALWIATGTGIAPFYSMLRAGLSANKTLLHGVRRADQFYFSAEWAAALGPRYHRFCSGETAEGAVHGRVNRYLDQNDLPADHRYYLCGQASMCVELRDALIARGVPFSRIVAEIYF